MANQAKVAAQSKRIGFIGLGVMGFPMAGHLAQAGHHLRVFNRTPDKAQRWVDQYQPQVTTQLRTAATPGEAAEDADIVFMCVGNDADVRQVALEKGGALAAMPAGSVLIDHTTASQQLALELQQACLSCNVGFMDAPVSGGQAGAENGQLTVMMGGDENTLAAVAPVLEHYSKKFALLGPVGSGQLAKMVNQICIAGVLQGLSEGVHFAQQAGLDVNQVVDVICEGAAQSWQMNNRAHTMAADEFEFGFAVDWMRKDLGIALQAARELNATLPMTGLVDQFYGDVQKMGGGRWDTSSLLRRLTGGN